MLVIFTTEYMCHEDFVYSVIGRVICADAMVARSSVLSTLCTVTRQFLASWPRVPEPLHPPRPPIFRGSQDFSEDQAKEEEEEEFLSEPEQDIMDMEEEPEVTAQVYRGGAPYRAGMALPNLEAVSARDRELALECPTLSGGPTFDRGLLLPKERALGGLLAFTVLKLIRFSCALGTLLFMIFGSGFLAIHIWRGGIPEVRIWPGLVS